MKNSALLLLIVLGLAGFSGCIRIAGSAGYWKKTAGEEAPEYNGASFDTQRLVQKKNQGSITMAP